jgi:transketolase
MGEATHATETGAHMLAYVGEKEIARIRRAVKDPVVRAEILADIFRLNTLYMIQKAGSGHIGTSMSAMDLVTYIWLNVLRNPNSAAKISDVFFSSKGHDAPGVYAVMMGLGHLPFTQLDGLRRLGGLPGHPDVGTDKIATNTGSLGMGISKARGMARAYRETKRNGVFYVMTGDGELQEGQIWESLQPTANGGYGNVVAVVDHNKIQSDTFVKDTSDLGDLEAKFRAFGWRVFRINGHDMRAIARTFKAVQKVSKKPAVIIADTVKGKGFPGIEKMDAEKIYNFHSGALAMPLYVEGLQHITSRIASRLKKLRIAPPVLTEAAVESRAPQGKKQNLIRAHGEALVEAAAHGSKFLVMDADLTKDLGLLPFKRKYPKRHVQAGIAEQDMVSFAGGLALQGIVPVVHSFACFMTPRANEQMYNNATEYVRHEKIVYVGGLAGLLPGMPGHSHQSVRDIAIMSAHPDLTIVEPTDEAEARRAVDFAVTKNDGSTYLRIVSVPWEVPFETPKDSLDKRGSGYVVREGTDCMIMAYGPILSAEAFAAAELLISASVCVMPWLNYVDDAWLVRLLKDVPRLLVLDNHYVKGGLGEQVAAAVARLGIETEVALHGVEGIPVSGQNDEVLAHHKLDRVGIAERVRDITK